MFEKIKEFASLVYKIGFINAIKITSGNTKKISLKNIKSSLLLHSGTSDIPTFKQIFARKQYDVKLHLNLSFIIDGGANIGLFQSFFTAINNTFKAYSFSQSGENTVIVNDNIN